MKKVLIIVIMSMFASESQAYKVLTSNNSFSLADAGTSVNVMNVNEFGAKAESHTFALKTSGMATSYTRSATWQILPDIGTPMGESIVVKFSIDHVSNYDLNRGCTALTDAGTNKPVFEFCGVENKDIEFVLKVGTKYRLETSAQSRFAGSGFTSSYVSKVMWSLPTENGKYTLAEPEPLVCSVN